MFLCFPELLLKIIEFSIRYSDSNKVCALHNIPSLWNVGKYKSASCAVWYGAFTLFSEFRQVLYLWFYDVPSSCFGVPPLDFVCQSLLISAGEVASVLSSDKAVTPRLRNVNSGLWRSRPSLGGRQCRTPQQTPHLTWSHMLSVFLAVCSSPQLCPQWN